jgi:hypothetical protein
MKALRHALLTLAIVASLTSAPTTAQTDDAPVRTITVRVLVINVDPILEARDGVRLHEYAEYNDPRWLADEYAASVKKISHNIIDYQIVEWENADYYPVKRDGFQYDDESYLECFDSWEGWHDPDGMDYPKMIEKFKLAERHDAGEFDEVWLFGAPYFGYWEAAMAGPGAFFINGGVYDEVDSEEPFAIMGFNYERGVAEMVHDLCHRTESTMSRVYGGWETDELTTNWARFAANEHQSGTAAVGTCHFPPNGEKHYDYANPRTVQSSADDWLDYPELDGETKPVNRETWGGPDYQLNYLEWWFTRLPRAPGWNEDGRLNNWWEYVFNFVEYDEEGKRIEG